MFHFRRLRALLAACSRFRPGFIRQGELIIDGVFANPDPESHFQATFSEILIGGGIAQRLQR